MIGKSLGHWLSISIGPALFAFTVALPMGEYSARGAIGLLLWMATWWIMRPVHLGVTSLLPLPVLAVFRFVPVGDILPAYSNIIVILLLGANLITVAWARWGVDRRVALFALLRLGSGAKRQVMVWFVLSVGLSTLLPNTIVAATLIPIAISMLVFLGIKGEAVGKSEFATGILLAVAWGTSVGGFGSPLGGSMNLVTIRFIEEMVTGQEFLFLTWIGRLMPLVIITSIPVLMYLLSFDYEFKEVEGARQFVQEQYNELGTFSQEERWCLGLMAGAAALAFLRPVYAGLLPDFHPAYAFLMAGILTFIVPARGGETLSTWEYARPRLMWGLFYLFAGGIALGRVIDLSGAGALIAEALSPFATMGTVVALLTFSGAAILLTNISSNTATVAIVAPIVITTMQGVGANPIPFLYVATAAANAGYVLPSSSGGPALAAGHGVNVGRMVSRGMIAVGLSLVALVSMGYLLMAVWPGFWEA